MCNHCISKSSSSHIGVPKTTPSASAYHLPKIRLLMAVLAGEKILAWVLREYRWNRNSDRKVKGWGALVGWPQPLEGNVKEKRFLPRVYYKNKEKKGTHFTMARVYGAFMCMEVMKHLICSWLLISHKKTYRAVISSRTTKRMKGDRGRFIHF